MRLAIPAEIVQLYFPESELYYDYETQGHKLGTKDGYTLPTVELHEADDKSDQLWCWVDDWPEVT